MTKLLMKWFVRDRNQPDHPKVRAQVGWLSGIVGIVCNILLFLGKLIVGAISGSVAIVADAINNLSDAASAIVTVIGFKLSQQPADADHPYGHARFEYLSGLAVAVIILIIGADLAKTSLGKIFQPEAVAFSLPVGIILVGSIGVKLWLSVFQGYLGRFIHSAALLASSADSRNDVISTSAVLAAGIVQWFTGWQIDGYMGLLVAVFILYSGWQLAKETISPLLGEAASPELQELIEAVVSSDDWVLGYHDLMVHDYGPGHRFASLHVEMDQKQDPLACHERIDDLERKCLADHQVHLVIHYDPVVTGDPIVDRLREQVLDILHREEQRLSIHDFRVVWGESHTNVIFDITLPWDYRNREKHLRKYVEKALTEENGSPHYAVITFDRQTNQTR